MAESTQQFQRRLDADSARLGRDLSLAESAVAARMPTRTHAWTSSVTNVVMPSTGPDTIAPWPGTRVLYASESPLTLITASATFTRLNAYCYPCIMVYGRGTGEAFTDFAELILDNRPVSKFGTTTKLSVSATYAVSLPPGRYDAYLVFGNMDNATISPTADTTLTVHSASITVKDI